MDSVIDDICETLRTEVSSIVEKLTSSRSRDAIVRSMLHSLPEYKELVEENIRLKSLQEEVRIIITEKSDIRPTEDGNLIMNNLIQRRLTEWSDKFEEFIDNMDQSDPIIDSLNQMKDDFDTEFSLHFNDKKFNNIVKTMIDVSDDSSIEDEIQNEHTDAASLEPASLEPASLEPASLEPASPEPASLETASIETASIEPASIEPASIEPASPEPASPEPASLEPASIEPASIEPASLSVSSIVVN